MGEYDIPQIEPTHYAECDWIGFNYARSERDRTSKGVHFFLDDYQFNSVWQSPDKYLEMFQQFTHVMSPDFSTYTDFPKVIQIYNHYRKHWIGAYLQENGVNVIPTISWSTPDSFEWCFDGEPVGGVVAVSSVGSANSRAKKELFVAGYDEMLARLQPETILFYGKVPEECEGNIVQIKAFHKRFEKEV
jgi:hypothetical protein